MKQKNKKKISHKRSASKVEKNVNKPYHVCQFILYARVYKTPLEKGTFAKRKNLRRKNILRTVILVNKAVLLFLGQTKANLRVWGI